MENANVKGYKADWHGLRSPENDYYGMRGRAGRPDLSRRVEDLKRTVEAVNKRFA